MRGTIIVISVISVLLISCGKKMKEADVFIKQMHLEMAKGNYEYIYDKLSGYQITSANSKEEIVDFFSNFLDNAEITEIKKTLGYSININNGLTKVESKYLWKGKNYDVKETIIVLGNKKGFKLEGINFKKIKKRF